MSYPIVGAHFRPPAKAVLQVLAMGHPLVLRKEPSNPYDPNAIMVLVETATIPEPVRPTLDALAQGFGHSMEEILVEQFFHLGYIPKTMAPALGALMAEPTASASYTATSAGAPACLLSKWTVSSAPMDQMNESSFPDDIH